MADEPVLTEEQIERAIAYLRRQIIIWVTEMALPNQIGLGTTNSGHLHRMRQDIRALELLRAELPSK